MKVVIVGVGRTGRELVDMLLRQRGLKLVLIDCDRARCDELAAELDALVLQGDGTHPELLQKAGLAEADALVAMTGSDALNTVIAMLGHRLGVEKIVVKLDDLGLRAACREFGVTEVVAPKIAAAASAQAALYGYHTLDLSFLARAGVRLIEVAVGAAVAGRRVEELDLPESCLLITVARGEKVIVPQGGTTLEAEDLALAILPAGADEQRLRQALSGS